MSSILYGLIAILLVLVGVVVVRAAREKEPPPLPAPPPAPSLDPRTHVETVPLSSDQWPSLIHPRGVVRLERTQNLVGRHDGGQIRPPEYDLGPQLENYVSRYQTLIYFERGAWYAKDLGSRNGTFINERRLVPNKPVLLRDRDRIAFTDRHEVMFLDEKSQENLPAVNGVSVVRLLAKGGMAAVYFGRMEDEKVALKTPIDYGEGEARANERIEDEYKILMKISNPRVPRAIKLCESSARQKVLVMEYVGGGTLRNLLQEKSQRPTIEEASLLCLAAADGLSALHAVGRVHCDVKPDNLMIRRDTDETGELPADAASRPLGYADAARCLLLIDFGITMEQLANLKNPFGSANYQSPEHIQGQQLTFKSDVYSLGCLYYELLTGSRLFPRAASVHEIKACQLNEVPRSPAEVIATEEAAIAASSARRTAKARALDARLDRLVMAMLSKSPGLRPTMDDVRKTISSVVPWSVV